MCFTIEAKYMIKLQTDNQKGLNAVKRCSLQNLKGTIAIDIVQQ